MGSLNADRKKNTEVKNDSKIFNLSTWKRMLLLLTAWFIIIIINNLITMRSYGNIGIIFSNKWTRRMLVTCCLSNTNIEGEMCKIHKDVSLKPAALSLDVPQNHLWSLLRNPDKWSPPETYDPETLCFKHTHHVVTVRFLHHWICQMPGLWPLTNKLLQ